MIKLFLARREPALGSSRAKFAGAAGRRTAWTAIAHFVELLELFFRQDAREPLVNVRL